MIEVPIASPDSYHWHHWFRNFVKETNSIRLHETTQEFYKRINENLVSYNAKIKENHSGRSIVVFNTKQDATFFLLKWS